MASKNLKNAAKSVSSHTTENMKSSEFVAREQTKRVAMKMETLKKLAPAFLSGFIETFKWGCELNAKVGAQVREFQLAVIEKSPDVAKLSLEIGERIVKVGCELESKSLDVQAKGSELLAEYFGDLNEGIFNVLGKFVDKVDWTAIITKAQENEALRAQTSFTQAQTSEAETRARTVSEQVRVEREVAESAARVEQMKAQTAYYQQQAETEKYRTEERKLELVARKRDLGLSEDSPRPQA